jgi:large subunit ribosomal protein L22
MTDTALAKLSSVRVSPRKLGLVAAAIRGLKADKALVQLEFMQKRIANEVRACLQSAIANAENNHNLDVDMLYVDKVLVGKAFVLKRFMPRARGRGAGIKKPFSNLTIILKEREEQDGTKG